MSQSIETYSRPATSTWSEVETAPYVGEEAAILQPENNTITERELQNPTSSTLRKAARTLEGLLRRNPNADFDPSQWLNNLEGDTDSALFARTLDNLGEEERPLSEEEQQVFNEMVVQVRSNALQLQSHLAEKQGFSLTQQEEAPEEELQDESEFLLEARELRELKGRQLAEMYAKRQKRMAGLDLMGENNFGKQALAFRRKRDSYTDAVQRQLALEVLSSRFDSKEAVDGFIAIRTAQLAKELTAEITKSYAESNGRLGKVINFLAGRKANGEPETSPAKKWGRRVLSYGIVPGALIGLTVATGGSLAVVGAAGAWTGTKMYSVFEAKHRYERSKRTKGLLSPKLVHARIRSVPEEIYANGAYEKLTPAEHVGVKIGRAAQLATRVFEKETVSQQKKRLVRAVGSAAVGTAVAFGGHYLGAWLQGGEQTANTDNANGWFGDKPIPASVPANTGGMSNIVANSNMGWYEVMQQIGIDPAQQHEALLRAAPALYKEHLAYQMSDGLPGIPSTGNIPKLAIDMLKFAAGK